MTIDEAVAAIRAGEVVVVPTGQTKESGPGQNAPARARATGSISTSPSSWEMEAASRFNSRRGGRPLMM